jgi:hypothetical protein
VSEPAADLTRFPLRGKLDLLRSERRRPLKRNTFEKWSNKIVNSHRFILTGIKACGNVTIRCAKDGLTSVAGSDSFPAKDAD